MSITLDGTNGITASNPATVKANAFLDAAGGNTATINGAIPAPATSPTLTTPIISGNLGAGGANYGTSGQVLTSGGTGASPSWSTISSGGMTLLGTLTTTSGTSQTLSGLTLTSYTQLQCVFTAVSSTATFQVLLGGIVITENLGASAGVFGFFTTDLTTGIWQSIVPSLNVVSTNTSGIGYPNGGIQSTITTASTSITFTVSAGTFDNGSIRIYGVK